MWPRDAPVRRIYVDFDPPQELVQGKDAATLQIVLPGYKKEHIKIEINDYGRIRITGERQMTHEGWSRFAKEFQVPDYCDVSKISARFADEVLRVTLPKLDAEDSAKDDDATKAAERTKVSDGSENGTKRRAESRAGESGVGGGGGGGGVGTQSEEEKKKEPMEASKDLQKVEESRKDRIEEASYADKVKSDSKHGEGEGNSSWKNLRNMVRLPSGSHGRRQLMLNGAAAVTAVLVGLGLYVIYYKN